MLPLHTEQIDKLTAAFIEAKIASRPVKEDAKANYGSYVSIPEIKSATFESLHKNGLSLTQGKTFHENTVLLVTQLTHTSGQWMRWYMPLYVSESSKNLDQAYGSSTSYQRRYDLYGIFGIMGEDNDHDSVQSAPATERLASEAQVKLLGTLLNGKQDALNFIYNKFGISSLDQLKAQDASNLISQIKGKQ